MTSSSPPRVADRVARVLAASAGLLAVVAALLVDGSQAPSLVLVVALAAVVVRRRPSAARLSLLLGIPAVLLTSWWWSRPASTAWFAYAPEEAPAPPGHGVIGIVVPVLLVNLWALAGIGLVATAEDASTRVPVRVLAVGAAVLTVPIWVSSLGGPYVLLPTQPTASAAVRTVSLVLVLVIGALVLTDRRRPSPWAAAFVVPATLLTWVGWQSSWAVAYGGGGGAPSFAAAALPDLLLLPAATAPLASVLLVALLACLSVVGTRALTQDLARYVPPPAATT
ncbi:hypothetical protein [Cellulomonas xylanilytica]|uniref:Uncharacterized protein n=1 Tax=Cellulomonas xylanilytica TaxID=233583 RepID=A0A510UZY0_9CELL|nr:hypothetical protein [Cellulomonas xylanilytica]GEK20218.1 hypothetical protein CXY01_07380 [Cellulomonas xylanilytica]